MISNVGKEAWLIMGDQLLRLFATQFFWLLMWAGVVLFLFKENWILGSLLFIGGIARFILEVKKEYWRKK